MRALIAALAVLLAGAPAALAEDGGTTVPELALDHPARINGIGMACTGVGSDARSEPRWDAYSLKLEFAGSRGEYLGYADVTLKQNGQALVRVRCPGPWLLFQLPPGRFDVRARVGQDTKDVGVRVRPRGQTRSVIHFSE